MQHKQLTSTRRLSNNVMRSACTLIFTGYGLKFNQCISTKGWDDRATNKKEVDCSTLGSQFNRCGKAFVDGKVADTSLAVYAKGCSASSVCSQKSCKAFIQDPSTTIKKCEFDCCEGDLCNGAKVPMISVIVILACAFVAFLC